MIRVSGGTRKGRVIIAGEGLDLRPTSGKVKGAIFNILGEKIQRAQFLDLFAGSGSVGIEALSRGAEHCTFIENNKNHFHLLKKNIEGTNFQNLSTLLCINAAKFKQDKVKYDVIFVDPPYSSGILEKILPGLGGSDMIQKEGVLLIEHFKKRELNIAYGMFSLKKQYTYGDTVLSLYQYS